jgi:hypothetical protein
MLTKPAGMSNLPLQQYLPRAFRSKQAPYWHRRIVNPQLFVSHGKEDLCICRGAQSTHYLSTFMSCYCLATNHSSHCKYHPLQGTKWSQPATEIQHAYKKNIWS